MIAYTTRRNTARVRGAGELSHRLRFELRTRTTVTKNRKGSHFSATNGMPQLGRKLDDPTTTALAGVAGMFLLSAQFAHQMGGET